MTDEMTLDELNWAIAEARGWTQEGEYKWREDGTYGGPFYHQELPAWSTDPAAALELLAEMNELSDFDLNDAAFSLVPSNAKSEVVFNEYHLGLASVFAAAPTPAKAIARAYLAWKAGQDDQN